MQFKLLLPVQSPLELRDHQTSSPSPMCVCVEGWVRGLPRMISRADPLLEGLPQHFSYPELILSAFLISESLARPWTPPSFPPGQGYFRRVQELPVFTGSRGFPRWPLPPALAERRCHLPLPTPSVSFLLELSHSGRLGGTGVMEVSSVSAVLPDPKAICAGAE